MAMLSALFTGITGMRNHQTMLDVISNNVANVNTVGFKAGRVQFRDLLSQTISGASGSDSINNRGGTNPVQFGTGVAVASIDTSFKQGTLQATGNATDLAINGDGFFITQTGNTQLYTRAGSFRFDSAGRLVDPSGGLIQGWSASIDPTDRLAGLTLDTSNAADIGNIQINAGMTLPPQETRNVELVGNLDAGSTYANLVNSAGEPGTTAWTVTDGLGTAYNYTVGRHVISTTIFDSLGNEHALTVTFTNVSSTQKPGAAPGTTYGNNQWIWQVETDPNDPTVRVALDNMTYADPATGELIRSGSHGEIHFNGTLVNGAPDHGSYGDANTAAELAAFGVTADPHVGYMIGIMNREIIGAGDFAGDTTATFNAAPFYDNPGVGGFAPFDIKKIPVVLLYQDVPGGTPPPPAGTTAGTLVNFNYTDMTTTGATPMQWYAQAINIDMGTLATQPDWDLDPDDDGAQGTPTDPYARGHTTLNDGQRDGLTQDTTGEFVDRAGVQVYVPLHSAYLYAQDGYAEGVLQGVAVDASGRIVGSFSNGETEALAQVAIATFENPAGLAKVGETHWTPTANSGNAIVGEALQGGRGSVIGGVVEQSNVDLSEELTNMIVAQRGFEVNARMITTADRVLDTLVNLGRG